MNLLLSTVNQNNHHHHHKAVFSEKLDCQSLNCNFELPNRAQLTDFNNNNNNHISHEDDGDDDDDDAEEYQYDYDGDNDDDDDDDDPHVREVSSTLENNLYLDIESTTTTGQTPSEIIDDESTFLSFSSYVNKNLSERKIRAQFYKDYSLGCRIGEGGFGIIFSGVRRKDNRPVAIKVIKKVKVNQWYEFKGVQCHESDSSSVAQADNESEGEVAMITRRIPLEIALMIRVRLVKNCIEILDYLEQDNCFIIVMERIENSKDLFDFITEKNGYGGLNEALCKEYFRQIVIAILAIHELGVVHRDIKDENILVDMNTNQVKLIDFGAGAFFNTSLDNNQHSREELKFTDFHGTRVYSPPEWILEQCYYGDRAAVWSLGVLLFNMIYGDIPWEEDSDIVNCRLNSKKNISLKKQQQQQQGATTIASASDAAVVVVDDLIRMCLHINQHDRIKLHELLHHKWFNN